MRQYKDKYSLYLSSEKLLPHEVYYEETLSYLVDGNIAHYKKAS